MSDLEAVTCFFKAVDRLDQNVLELEPSTVEEITGYDREDVEKIFMVGNVIENSQAHDNYHIFQKAVVLFNNRRVDFYKQQTFSVPEMCWATYCISSLDPVSPFSNEVGQYIGGVLHLEGFVKVPETLQNIKTMEDGFSIQEILKRIQVDPLPLFDEAEKVQDSYLKACKDYVSVRREKLIKELQSEDNRLLKVAGII